MPFPITYSGTQICKNPIIFPLGMDIHPPGSGWPERKVLWDSPGIVTGFWPISFGFVGLGQGLETFGNNFATICPLILSYF